MIFNSVIIDATDNSVTSTDRKVTFRGTYDPITFTTESKSILFLGAENTLYWPQPADDQHPVSIGACRAYFQLNGLTAATLSRFMLNFGDGSETMSLNDKEVGAWYDLSGRKLDGVGAGPVPARLRKGIYLHGGKKVVIK